MVESVQAKCAKKLSRVDALTLISLHLDAIHHMLILALRLVMLLLALPLWVLV